MINNDEVFFTSDLQQNVFHDEITDLKTFLHLQISTTKWSMFLDPLGISCGLELSFTVNACFCMNGNTVCMCECMCNPLL